MKQDASKQKVILAFSGGLDTSYCVVYLKEKGYDVVTLTVNTGGFGKEQLVEIEKKAYELGAIKHYTVDAQELIYEQIMQYIIKLNAKYEGDYPLMCADRYVIAQETMKIAEKEGTNIVSHGSTAVGNDQVRFDAALFALKPDVKILCPIKIENITRPEEIEYLNKRGFPVAASHKKYSMNENVFGLTISGSEIDQNKEPAQDAFQLTKKTMQPGAFEHITLEFEHGLPTTLNGKPMAGIDIIKQLNSIVGKYGYGRVIYTGDCIIGIKGRIAFEAPGLFTVIEAHRKLEQMTLTKHQIKFNVHASDAWTDLVYSGLYYEPLVKSLETYADAAQLRVSGKVTLRIEENMIHAVAIETKNSLIKKDVAMYAQKAKWSAQDADGFIKMYTMQQTLARMQ